MMNFGKRSVVWILASVIASGVAGTRLHAQDKLPVATTKAKTPSRCTDKAGQAVGITRGFAEYEAFLIIRQMSGNWPLQTDRISQPTYVCTPDGVMWSCIARARICKS